MKEKKYCIFHVPNHIDIDGKSGSHVRPRRMVEAFQSIGYHVDVVMGYGKERKNQIRDIKKEIIGGRKYDFLYSESSTMPTLLTEQNHLPLYPNLDFGFFKFCKKHGIKIGLFYRDIHWKFEKYKKEVSKIKQAISIPMYKYDLLMYKKLVDVMYLPSLQMQKQIEDYHFTNIKELPPGAIKNEEIVSQRRQYFEKRQNGNLRLFYVGGVQGIYDLTELLKEIHDKKYVYLTICCREKEWQQEYEKYAPYLTERIQVLHESGKTLEKYYLEADICSCYFKNSVYMDFAVPIKLLEYTSYVTPIIATKGTVAGKFIDKAESGFVISCKKGELGNLLDIIYEEQAVLVEKHRKAVQCLEENTWVKRAYQVQMQLKDKNR